MGYWRTYFSTAEEIGLGRHGEEMEMDRWATSELNQVINPFSWYLPVEESTIPEHD